MDSPKLRARHALLAVMACVLVTATSGTAAAAPGPVLIDDFSSGAYNLTIHAQRDLSMQQGSMIGGVRCGLLDAKDPNPYNRSSQLGLGTGHMFVETGVRVGHSMTLMYGYDKTCADAGNMNLDLTSLDRFRIDFDLVSLDLAGVMQVWSPSPDGIAGPAGSTIPICVDGVAAGVSFTCDMPFSGFLGNVDWSHVEYITVLFQSAGTIFAHEYSINSIRAISEPGAAAGQHRSTATSAAPSAPRQRPTIPRPGR